MKKKKIWGIVLLVFGIISVLGAMVNGFYAGLANSFDFANLVTISLQIASIAGGAYLIYKSKEQ